MEVGMVREIAWGGIFLASAASSAAVILLLRGVLQRYALARPNARSSHREPTPQGGGIAVIAATLGTTTAFILFVGDTVAAHLWPVFAATAFLALVGAWDDITFIPVALRLFLQAAAIALVIAALPADLRVFSFLPWWIERVLLLLAGLWFVNLVNFMDGIDWMTVAEVVPITAGLVLLGLFGALPDYGIVVALALGGAMVGFAPFNRPVAKLFLGDVGSLPIGLLLGWLLLLLAAGGHLAAAVLLPLYYLTDATVTLLRRLWQGKTPWLAHRDHFYQHAVDDSFTVRDVVAQVFAVNLGLIALAAATVLMPSPPVDLVALALGFGLVAWLLGRFRRGSARL
jgi:UDP-N-acetylmuramyl pentapeptide phosphotransferase/UDP-N-acetylglucosamine-1-phosphate transferase